MALKTTSLSFRASVTLVSTAIPVRGPSWVFIPHDVHALPYTVSLPPARHHLPSHLARLSLDLLEVTVSPFPSSGQDGRQCCPHRPTSSRVSGPAGSVHIPGQLRTLPPLCPASRAMYFLTLTNHHRLKASPYIWKLFYLFTLEIQS